ncbi:MAG: GGDEF domain-containing protein [Terracidiphilus sp.]|jgi:diguanylate cyclase (GGDEF)-like protein
MKRFLFPAAILLATVPAAAATPPAPAASSSPLMTLHAAATITNAEATKRLPVAFEATVTYYRWYDKDLFVQDGNDAIYVHANTALKLAPGDRILIRGTTHESFRPYVNSSDITIVGHGPLPKPVQPSFEQMIRGESDCRFVTVRAAVRSADLVPDIRSTTPAIYLRMLVDGGMVDANIDSDDESALKNLLDAEVQVTGSISGHFDNKMQMTGILLHVQSLAGVKILKPAGSDPWSLPVTPMDRIITGYRTNDSSQRMHVRGTITYYEPGTTLVLQDGPRSLWINTDSWNPLHVGDVADAVGFPSVENGFLTLTRSEIRDSLVPSPVSPALFTWLELARGGNDGRSHVFDLVSIEGQVVTEVRQATQDEYVLQAGDHLFSAFVRHPGPSQSAPPSSMREIPEGTRVRVTGICMLEDANPFNGEVPFSILMRSVGDIQVVARPPWLNVRHLMLIVEILFALVIALGVLAWYMERRNRRRIGSLAYVEQRRARILEAINHSKPLAEILERITELVSMRLSGAPCWCEVADGATLGNRPVQLDSSSLRTVEQPIAARSGSALGSIFAAFDARTNPDAMEKAALAMAAELATLAIETSRLYSDLVHRSEFDLLTDVQNRFAMEKTLDAMIQTARETAGIFGLIYIDLNEFKQVNDLHGHLVGDQYLQEVSRRMKQQLRPCDALARLGGDEFAVLVSEVRNRAEVEEISARLQSCFHEPFIGDGYILHGSASFGIALYPEDADSADSLLHSADAAMYVAKYTRLGETRVLECQPHVELVPKDDA